MPVTSRRAERLKLPVSTQTTATRLRRTILGGQRPFAGRLFPQLLPQPVHALQEVLRAQLAEGPPPAWPTVTSSESLGFPNA